MTADNEEGHYYALVRTEYPSAYPVDKDDVYTDDVNKFAGWKYVFDDALDKLAIEQGQLTQKVEKLQADSPNRSSWRQIQCRTIA